ncbi:MAG: restriction endonuclease subunit S, partial [Candidatus Vogelbacteria bacterium]|nr:restriction endonuclease subunit S [Candidatus Vogelbacteria bacterium]
IVKKIEELFAKIDEVKKFRAEAIKDTESLLPSALHKIFSEGKVNGWAEKKIEEVCEHPQYGYTESANSKLVGPKFLRITDIQNGEVNWGYVPYCLCDDVAKYELKNGDLVFARTGATVGKSYLIKNIPVQSVFASYLIRLRAVKDVLPDFLYYFFQSPD